MTNSRKTSAKRAKGIHKAKKGKNATILRKAQYVGVEDAPIPLILGCWETFGIQRNNQSMLD